MNKRSTSSITAIAALALLLPGLASTIAVAQQGPASATQPKPQQGHDGRPHDDHGRDNRGMDGPTYNIMPEGMNGRWWHIPDLAQKIGLSADQQKRMDDILHQRLTQLGPQMHDLHQQRDTLQAMLDANQPDAAKLKPLFEHVAQSRAALEVARDQMLLEIRNVLTADQWSKLRTENQRWQAAHPDTNQHNNDRRDDHRNTPGKPAGASQPPA